MSKKIQLFTFTLIIVALTSGRAAYSQAAPPLLVGLGDSIGEGVQSADANEATQPFSYLHLLAWRMGAPFPLPLIRTSLFASVGDTTNRHRVDPTVQGLNLAVSGADVTSLLQDRADATTTSEINSETDLVMFPRVGSQMEVAESLHPQNVACWIGANDALGAALSFDQLDASQLTPVPEFTARVQEIANRLHAMGSRVVFATIPDVGQIAYLLDRQDLIRFLGSDFGLPAGSKTTLPLMLMVKLGLASPAELTNPQFVLDPSEQQVISDRIHAFNDVIKQTAAAHGMGVVDVHAVFQYFVDAHVTVAGVPITTRFLGGLFSLDGVHPSNIGQALVANMFVDAFNSRYGLNIPQIDGLTMYWLFITDPFIDKDGDGRVTGRFGQGFLETIALFLGLSGDQNDYAFTPQASAQTTAASATSVLDSYARQTGRDLRSMPRNERMQAFKQLFGLARGRR